MVFASASRFAGMNRFCNWKPDYGLRLNIKIGYDIHALMRDADDVDSISGDFIEDQVRALREAMVTGFYLRPLFSEPRIFR